MGQHIQDPFFALEEACYVLPAGICFMPKTAVPWPHTSENRFLALHNYYMYRWGHWKCPKSPMGQKFLVPKFTQNMKKYSCFMQIFI